MIMRIVPFEGKTYYYGAIWQQPGGREAAADSAQVRVFERELDRLAGQEVAA